MATYTRQVLQIERVEFHVPAPEPWGATWVEVSKAINAATVELRQRELLAEDATPAESQINVKPWDDEIIVSVEVRTRSES
jgi:hypothetical protein